MTVAGKGSNYDRRSPASTNGTKSVLNSSMRSRRSSDTVGSENVGDGIQAKFKNVFQNISREGNKLLDKESNKLVDKVNQMKVKKSMLVSEKTAR